MLSPVRLLSVWLLDDLSQITFVLDDMSQKGAICSKIIWTICHNFFSTWTICHTFILDDLSQVIFVLDDMSKKERSGYGADRSQLSFS